MHHVMPFRWLVYFFRAVGPFETWNFPLAVEFSFIAVVDDQAMSKLQHLGTYNISTSIMEDA